MHLLYLDDSGAVGNANEQYLVLGGVSGEGLLAGVGERDERGGAESEFAASSADDEPLDPAAGAGGLDEKVQPVAVSVPSLRGGTDEGGRERLGGMPASALGSRRRGRDFDYSIHHECGR